MDIASPDRYMQVILSGFSCCLSITIPVMDLASFRQLLTPSGQAALQAAVALQPREVDFLAHFSALQKQYPADLARAALETAILRREASREPGAKFPQAGRMYFTRPALEQASSTAVSEFRSARLRGFDLLVDLGCSIGGDTLSLARLAPALAIDLDPLRLEMAAANLATLNLAGVNLTGTNLASQCLASQCLASLHPVLFIQADLNSSLPITPSTSTAVFFDPARRDAGGRIYSVEGYHPPLSSIQGWLERFPALGVKLSPGVDLSELSPYPAEVEFISLHGELKEAVLWFGPLHSGVSRRASLLPGPYSFIAETKQDLPPQLSQPLEYLYEPDPAILRAGLVRELAVQLGAYQLDPEISYLTAPHCLVSPFARSWQVDAWFPFSLKRLRTELRARGVGQVVVKKRGSPLVPEQLIHELRLKGEAACTVFLTQLRGKPVAILCHGRE
jgi:hypothetical protein